MVLLPLPGVTMTVTASRFVRQGKANARTLTRAWILLKLADGWDEGKIAETFAVTWTTVKNVAHRFTEGGLDLVLHDKVQQRRRQALTGKPPAHLIAITCSPTPDGHDHWTVRRLSNKAAELGFVSSISSNTIHQLLKKRAEWQTCLEMSEKCPWCHPKMSVPQAKIAIQPFFSAEWQSCLEQACWVTLSSSGDERRKQR